MAQSGQPVMEPLERLRRRRRRFGWFLLPVLLYHPLITLVFLFLPIPELLVYLTPGAFLYDFLSLWFDPGWLLLLLSLVPLAGWVLLHRQRKVGRWLILLPQLALLAMNAVVTPFHLLIGAGSWSVDYVKSSFYLSLAGLFYPALVLLLLHCWRPRH